MRRYAAILVAMVGLACPPTDAETMIASQPAWIDWPAEVRASVPFNVRLVGYAPGCYPRQEFQIEAFRSANDLVFRTTWLVEGTSSATCDPGFVDTLVGICGLPATTDSTYEIFVVPTQAGAFVRMGTMRARPSAALSSNVGAAGSAIGTTDTQGCAVMQRNFAVPVPVENPPAANWQGFVRGYFFTPATPLCGKTRAFHIDDLDP